MRSLTRSAVGRCFLYGVEGGRCQCGNPDCKSPGKHPTARNGVKSATRDKGGINLTFKDGNNLGIATGAKSGIWVLDIDGPTGEASLLDLQQRYGDLPATLEHRTGRGRHPIFDLAGEKIKNSVKRLGDGLDVRGDGGYIVAVAPSRHVSGTAYRMGRASPSRRRNGCSISSAGKSRSRSSHGRCRIARLPATRSKTCCPSYIRISITNRGSRLACRFTVKAIRSMCGTAGPAVDRNTKPAIASAVGVGSIRQLALPLIIMVSRGNEWMEPDLLEVEEDTSAADAFIANM